MDNYGDMVEYVEDLVINTDLDIYTIREMFVAEFKQTDEDLFEQILSEISELN